MAYFWNKTATSKVHILNGKHPNKEHNFKIIKIKVYMDGCDREVDSATAVRGSYSGHCKRQRGEDKTDTSSDPTRPREKKPWLIFLPCMPSRLAALAT